MLAMAVAEGTTAHKFFAINWASAMIVAVFCCVVPVRPSAEHAASGAATANTKTRRARRKIIETTPAVFAAEDGAGESFEPELAEGGAGGSAAGACAI